MVERAIVLYYTLTVLERELKGNLVNPNIHLSPKL